MKTKPKVIFISNFINHHQIEFCDEMHKCGKFDFFFVALAELPDEKITIGYEDFNSREYVVQYFSESSKKENYSKISGADIVLCPPNFNSIPFCDNAKIIFIVSEHIFKTSPTFSAKNIARYFKYKSISLKFRKMKKRTYILCSSYKTKKELSICGFTWVDGFVKWGYFPKNDYLFECKKSENVCNILWVNRMISWKHPERALKILQCALQQNINANLTFIGDGPKKESVILKAKKMKLFDKCCFCGYLPNKEVLKKMASAHYILSTSDRGEGWGATINEGMLYGCVPIVDYEIGCSKFLVNKTCGIIYKKADKILFPTFNEWQTMSNLSISRIRDLWNGKVAQRNFMKIISNESKFSKDNNDMPGTYTEV